MDQKLKERLIGAAVLVALVVLIVPALLTGPRGDRSSSAPQEDQRREVIDLTRPPGAQPAQDPTPETRSEATPAATDTADVPPAPSTRVAPALPSPATTTAAATGNATATAPAPASASGAVGVTAAPKGPAVTAAPPVVKASESPTDSKIVQKPDVKASGASESKAAHVDAAPPKPDAKSDSKAPSKAAAVEPQSKTSDKSQAKAAGHPETKNEARVSPPAAVAAPKPAPAASAVDASAGWVVQLGSFASKENAEKLARELKAKKFKAFVSEFRGGGKTLWRVRVGPEQDRARIDRIAERLQGEGHKGNVAPVQ